MRGVFRFFGEAVAVPPLPPTPPLPPAPPLPPPLPYSATQPHQRCAVRALAASSSARVPVVVFGASVSAGCGAEAPSHRCQAHRSPHGLLTYT